MYTHVCGTTGKELACQCMRLKRCGFDPRDGSIPWRRVWQPTPVFLPGESHGQGSLKSCSLRGRRVRHHWRNLARVHTYICVCGCVYTYIYIVETASLENRNTNFKKCGAIGYITECQLKCPQESWGKQLRVRRLPPIFAETSSSLCLLHSPAFSRDADIWSSSSQLQWKKIQTPNTNRLQIQDRNTNFCFVQVQNRNSHFDLTEAVGLDGTAAHCKPGVL